MNKAFWLMLSLLGLHAGWAGADEPDVWRMIGEGALVIDVRSPDEFAAGHLDAALNIAHDRTEELVKAIGTDKGRAVVLYCRSGRRSSLALQELVARGYTHVVNGGPLAELIKNRPDRK